MNKVVCNICGTSYPENAAQCPICGYVHSTENEAVSTSYTYVKGGRYSKANVRKRNQEVQHVSGEPIGTVKDNTQSDEKKSRSGAVFLIIVLLMAIIAVIAYIALRFFVPNDFLYEGFENFKTPAVTQTVTEAMPEHETEASTQALEDKSCKNIKILESEVAFNTIGSSTSLTVSVEPADTKDPLVFTSSDPSVIRVDENGIITAEGYGSALITVSCGNISKDVIVSCIAQTEAEPDSSVTLVLNRKEITFDAEGQSWMLYDGSIAVSAITWSSDDNTVATIVDGKVHAVGNGDTTVYATYEGQTVSCIIHCSFAEEGAGSGNGGVSEAGGDSQRICKLYNPYGNSDDVTMQVGEQFPLSLVDDEKNTINDATWSINDDTVCSYEDGVVTALASGTTEVTATFEGNSYTCIVRVK